MFEARRAKKDPTVAIRLGEKRLRAGDLAGAAEAYRWAADSGHPDAAGWARSGSV